MLLSNHKTFTEIMKSENKEGKIDKDCLKGCENSLLGVRGRSPREKFGKYSVSGAEFEKSDDLTGTGGGHHPCQMFAEYNCTDCLYHKRII